MYVIGFNFCKERIPLPTYDPDVDYISGESVGYENSVAVVIAYSITFIDDFLNCKLFNAFRLNLRYDVSLL